MPRISYRGLVQRGAVQTALRLLGRMQPDDVILGNLRRKFPGAQEADLQAILQVAKDGHEAGNNFQDLEPGEYIQPAGIPILPGIDRGVFRLGTVVMWFDPDTGLGQRTFLYVDVPQRQTVGFELMSLRDQLETLADQGRTPSSPEVLDAYTRIDRISSRSPIQPGTPIGQVVEMINEISPQATPSALDIPVIELTVIVPGKITTPLTIPTGELELYITDIFTGGII